MAVDRSPNRSVLIGTAIVIGAILVTVVVFFIPDVKRKLTPSIELVAVMADAGALETGSEVWVAGHEVGTVLKVEVRPAGSDSMRRIAVTMDVPSKYSENIQRGSEVRLTTETLIGKPVLDILPGGTGGPIRDGDTLVVRQSGNLTGLLERTEAMTARSHQFFRDLETVERRTTNRAAEIRRLNRNLKVTMTEFSALMKSMGSSPMQTFSDPEFKRLIDRVMNTSGQLSKALDNAADRAWRAKSDAEPSLRRLAARADTIQGIVSDIQMRIQEGGGGILIRAQKDSAIVKAIHEAQVRLDSLIAETTRSPWRFWF